MYNVVVKLFLCFADSLFRACFTLSISVVHVPANSILLCVICMSIYLRSSLIGQDYGHHLAAVGLVQDFTASRDDHKYFGVPVCNLFVWKSSSLGSLSHRDHWILVPPFWLRPLQLNVTLIPPYLLVTLIIGGNGQHRKTGYPLYQRPRRD